MIQISFKNKKSWGDGKLVSVWIFAFYDIRFKPEEKPGMKYKLILFKHIK